MKRLILIISILFVIFNSGYSQCKKGVESQVIINEIGSFVSHNGGGSHANAEYIELLVIGDANRPFSPISIKGLIIDDNNSTEIEVGSEPGHIRLSKDFPMVNPGTIILIFDPNGFVIDKSDDGVPNSSGIFQIPINSPLIERCNNSPAHFDGGFGSGGETSDYLAECIEHGDEWDEYLPFRNWGDVAQIRTSDGQIVHSVAWNSTLKDLPQPEGSIYFETDLSNKSIQLITGDYSNQSSYRVSGYSSPGEPNSPENEKFINELKNGVINKFGDFKVTIIKNQTKGNQDAEIEVELLGDLDPEIKWKVYVDDVEINNPNKDNPFLIKDLSGGTKTISVEIWNEELEQFCPFENTIEIPIDELELRDVCEGKCKTLESMGQHCVAWIDEDGNILSNDDTYTICPEKDVIITELIENANGLVVKRILHNINVKSKSYHLSMIIPDECPPSEVKLMVVGSNLTITWEDGSTEEKKSVSSAGIYKVTVVDENGCTYDETFTVSDDIFNDSDGDGVCDDKDCNPDDNTQTYKKGDPCDDGQACTINDKYDVDCNCVGETPKYGLEVAITGDINICYSQESTTLTADASGGWEPYNILWSTGETTAKILIKEISQDGGETYSVTVTDATGCSESASVQLTRYESDDTDGDGYCDEVDCAKYSAELGGPGSPCDDGDPHTINDVHDENCNCAGVPSPCITDIDGDGVCKEDDCNDLEKTIGAVGSPCDDGDPNTINDRMNDECHCVGEFDQRLCKGSVTIDIYNGLYGSYGGQIIPNSDKLTKGAVTVANKNDTNGNGHPDKDDFEVLAGPTGRDEVDLMKLIIKPTGFTKGCKVKIEPTGNIAFYNKSTKGPKITNLKFDATKNTIIWVEAISESLSVRDIIIKARAGGIVKDEVKATAIWVQKKNVFYTRSATPTPNGSSLSINKKSMLDYILYYSNATDGTWWGFGSYRPIPPNAYPKPHNNITGDGFFGGRILYEYELLPTDVHLELLNLGISYDLTRRISRNSSFLKYNSFKFKQIISAHKAQNEEANDDEEKLPPNGPGDFLDEDETPTANEIYQYDAPSQIIVGYQSDNFAVYIKKLNFEDFARVSFGKDIVGNIQEGSRCSDKYIWELEYTLKSSGSYYPSDPYNGFVQKLEPVSSGGLTYTIPRRLSGSSTVNILINPISSLGVEAYILVWDSSINKWKLIERTSTGNILRAQSPTSSTGPWTINYTGFVEVSISTGTLTPSVILGFHVLDLPAPTNKLTAK